MLFAAVLSIAVFSCTTKIDSPPPPLSEEESSSSTQDIKISSSSVEPVKPPDSPCGFTDNQIVTCCFKEDCKLIEYSACYFFDGVVQDVCVVKEN